MLILTRGWRRKKGSELDEELYCQRSCPRVRLNKSQWLQERFKDRVHKIGVLL